jgi:hypothetical protein
MVRKYIYGLCAIFHKSDSHSLVSVFKTKTKEKFRPVQMLFYILPKKSLTEVAYFSTVHCPSFQPKFSGASRAPTSQVYASAMLSLQFWGDLHWLHIHTSFHQKRYTDAQLERSAQRQHGDVMSTSFP